MRLLVCTQKIDKNDPILGFFHCWVEEFAKHCEKIFVVCLEKGEYDLPENVEVFSLGKEAGKPGRLVYAWRFLRFITARRHEYDSVFVHMNQEYILLGGLFWRLAGKRIAFWYNHTIGSWKTRIAGKFAHTTMHTSPYAHTASFKNAQQMPAGIDVETFRPLADIKREPRSILYLGRIAPLKNVHILIEAALVLESKGKNFILNIYGDARREDAGYFAQLKTRARSLTEQGKCIFHDPITQADAPHIYNKHEVFVNLTPSGNYDKTVLEAMACGTLVAASSEAFADNIPDLYRPKEDDPTSLARVLESLLSMPEDAREEMRYANRAYVAENHDIRILAKAICTSYAK